jgi:hypothetical protein
MTLVYHPVSRSVIARTCYSRGPRSSADTGFRSGLMKPVGEWQEWSCEVGMHASMPGAWA